MPTLMMTVGLPRSGKSTWASTMGYPIVCPDAIRLALHGRPFIPEAEPMVWTIARLMVRALFNAGHETVILDATNTTKARRDEWLSDQWQRQWVVFSTGLDECLSRAVASGRTDLIPVIERMARHFEALHGESDGLPSILVDSQGRHVVLPVPVPADLGIETR